jgi:hypothetical protein
MFNFFKRDPQSVFRRKVRKGFEQSVKEAKQHCMGDPMMDGLLIQAAIGNFSKAMKESPGIQIIGLGASGWIPEEVIDEEASRCLNKYTK